MRIEIQRASLQTQAAILSTSQNDASEPITYAAGFSTAVRRTAVRFGGQADLGPSVFKEKPNRSVVKQDALHTQLDDGDVSKFALPVSPGLKVRQRPVASRVLSFADQRAGVVEAFRVSGRSRA